MFKSKNLQRGLGIALLLLIAASIIIAQEAGNRRGQGQDRQGQQGQQRQQPGQRPGPGGPGGFDRGAMQERMLTMMQERLGISEEEWKVVKPRLSEVMKLSQSASGRGGMMRGMFGRGRGRGPEGQQETPTDPVEKAVSELQTTLEKDAPSAAEINAKLTALRGAKEKAKQQLVVAQKKLREVLTLKQEAGLVLMGMLD